MHKVVVGIGIGLGILAVLATALWCLIAVAFGEFERNGGAIILLLMGGPLSLLPAAIVGRKRPLFAGIWLVAAAIFSFFWHLGVIMHEGFRQLSRSFEAWLPVTLICVPTFFTGAGFLWVGRAVAFRFALGCWQSPTFRRRLAIVGVTLGAVAFVGLLWYSVTRPVWVVSVTPNGQPTRSLRLDPQDFYPALIMEGEEQLKVLFADLFRQAGPSGQTVLGTSAWTGSKTAGGTFTWVAVRDERGLLLILRNGEVIDRNWMVDPAAFSNATRFAAREIVEQAWREFPPGP